MKQALLANFFLIFFWNGISIFAAVPESPSNCRIQDYYSSLGIDTKTPRFSWVINDNDRGEKQSAYEILVASGEVTIDSNQGDLWSTGKIGSDSQYGIEYSGQALKSTTKYWWKVRTWDKDGNVSPWSAKSSFVTGFLNATDKAPNAYWICAPQQRAGLAFANWIWGDVQSKTNDFKSVLQMPDGKTIVSAKASITADSTFTFTVNDKLVAQGNDFTTVTDIDLASVLHSGSNVLLIHAQKAKSDKKKGGAIVRIEVRLNGGELILCLTDDRAWTVAGDNGTWKPATVVATFGSEPWLPRLFKNITVNDHPPLLRKVFNVDKKVKEAFLFISGLGVFEASLNGKKIGNQIIPPAWTDYDKSVNYVTFDVKNMLQSGANALGVLLGNGWFDYQNKTRIKRHGMGESVPRIRQYGIMRLFSQLNIQYEDGSTEIIVSDPSWKTSESPYTMAHVYGSEQYDARLEQLGWNTILFSDNNWKQAEKIEAPFGNFEAQKVPPVIERAVYKTIKHTTLAPDVQVFDIGQNINGQHEIKVSGPAGAVLTIVPAEVLDNGRARPTKSDFATYSTYTLKGNGIETWRLTLSTAGFRYIEIQGATNDSTRKDMPFIHDVKGYFTYTAAAEVGSFYSSDKRYNQIYELALKTLQSNQITIHTDCPTYEKLGWQEVVPTTAPSYGYLFNTQALWNGMSQNLREAQRNNGLVPNIVPVYTAGRGDFDDSPAWGVAMFALPWLQYWTYGDQKVLEDNYYAMRNYLNYLKTREDKGGVLGYGLGDWMAPAGTQKANVEGSVYVWDVQLMRNIAEVLKKTDDYAFFSKEFTRVKDAYNKAFLEPIKGQYQPIAQVNQVLPLAFGIVPDNNKQSVSKALREVIAKPDGKTGVDGNFGPVLPNHLTVGDIGATYLFRVLGDMGRSDLVDTIMMQPDYPGLYNFIKMGLTTIPESWRFDKSRSMNHDMYAGILEWYYRSVAGISNIEPGYKKIQIKPALNLGLNEVKCSYESVRGTISSNWKKVGEKIILDIKIPVNTTAEVYIPAKKAQSVTENGKPLTKINGTKFLRIENGNTIYELGSGSYNFTVF